MVKVKKRTDFDPADRKNRFYNGTHDMRRAGEWRWAGRDADGVSERGCRPCRNESRAATGWTQRADVSAGPQRRAFLLLDSGMHIKRTFRPYGAGTPRKGENRLIPAAVRRTSPPMRRIPREERYSAGRCFPRRGAFGEERESPGRWSLTAGAGVGPTLTTPCTSR